MNESELVIVLSAVMTATLKYLINWFCLPIKTEKIIDRISNVFLVIFFVSLYYYVS